MLNLISNYSLYCTKGCSNSVELLDVRGCAAICSLMLVFFNIMLIYSIIFIYTIIYALFNYKTFREFVGDIVIHNIKIILLLAYIFWAYQQTSNIIQNLINK